MNLKLGNQNWHGIREVDKSNGWKKIERNYIEDEGFFNMRVFLPIRNNIREVHAISSK